MSIYENNFTGDRTMEKKHARAHMSGIREAIGPEGRARMDGQIAEKLCAHPTYEQADTVFTYLSVRSEVDTRAIIRDAWSKGKTVAIPRCVPGTRRMEWYRIDDFEGLEKSALGVEEPPANPDRLVAAPGRDEATNAIAIVPGYSFDLQNFRLGYGGGFYDVFLEDFGGTSIGLCRSPQVSKDPLPRDEHDLPVDLVVTD